MTVIGADTHKGTHTLAAVDAATGQRLSQRTVPADRDGMLAAWRWAHELGAEQVWALEDCAGSRRTAPTGRRIRRCGSVWSWRWRASCQR